jgi:hypothetical protein
MRLEGGEGFASHLTLMLANMLAHSLAIHTRNM